MILLLQIIEHLKKEDGLKLIEEAEKLCDRIAIIHEGKIAKIETTKQLKKEKKLNLYGVFLKYTK